jgi:hypothetical protein
MRGEQKKIREVKFENYRIDAANSDRVAYWRKVHLYLPPLNKENKFKSKANNLLHLSYLWGHCLKIVLYLAETEIY